MLIAALHMASANGHVEIVSTLLARGAVCIFPDVAFHVWLGVLLGVLLPCESFQAKCSSCLCRESPLMIAIRSVMCGACHEAGEEGRHSAGACKLVNKRFSCIHHMMLETFATVI